MHILVIEDEEAIADFIERGLRAEGHVVESVFDGVEGERRALRQDLDLVVLDVMLPGRDGFEIVQSMRAAQRSTPVIMLSARAEIADRVRGLDAGANDYLPKPFSFEELAARVRAHLRVPSGEHCPGLRAAGIELDLLSRRVTRDGQDIRLSAKELDLLIYFMRHPDRVLSRAQLLTGAWGYDFDPGTNVVEVYVGYLRRKLAQPQRPAPIETVRSIGYRLRDARS